MRKLFLLILLLMAIPCRADIQTRFVRSGTTLPAACGNLVVLFHLTQADSGNAAGIYRCSGGTYTPVVPAIPTFTSISMTESAAPSGASGIDKLWGDSTAHRLKMNNNNGGADTIVGANTPDTLANKTINGASNTISGITEAMMSFSDVTTLDVSTTKHGFVPKAPNDTSKFLRGDGSWAATGGVTGTGTLNSVPRVTNATGPVYGNSAISDSGTVIALGTGGDISIDYDNLQIVVNDEIAFNGLASFVGAVGLNTVTSLTPQTAGGTTAGSNALPFSSAYIGASATNNIQLTGTATGARIATFPDLTGTVLLNTSTTPLSSSLGSDGTTTSTSLATTGLSVTVVSGSVYEFTMILFVSDSLAADGAKIDFNGGSAAATNFRAHITSFDSALNLSTQVTTLNTGVGMATLTGASMIEVHGTFTPSSSGTFIPRYAQNAHTTGTLTIFQGSNLILRKVG